MAHPLQLLCLFVRGRGMNFALIREYKNIYIYSATQEVGSQQWHKAIVYVNVCLVVEEEEQLAVLREM